MGLNFFKKLFGTEETISEPKDITEELKSILHKKWRKQKKVTEGIPFDELYIQMVEEAVLTIKNEWKESAEYQNNYKQSVNELEIEAFNVFFVTEELALQSSNLYRPVNPKTGYKCFYANFTFPMLS